MVIDSFYLSNPRSVGILMGLTELSIDEIEDLVGRFRANHHSWAGCLMGEVLVMANGAVKIRHHFTKKLIWSNECDF